MRVAVFVCLVAAAAAFDLMSPPLEETHYTTMFEQFKAKFAKKYSDVEHQVRYAVFKDNVDFIHKHNFEAEEGKHSYTLGVNQFADLTQAEYAAQMLRPMNRTRPLNVVRLPEVVGLGGSAGSVDWRSKGAVTPIKNQGQCGSCWSFSTTGSVEGAHAIATGKLVSLSEQQLVDCSKSFGNMGCNGGLMDYAFKYIISNGGLDTEDDYPYTARTGTCDSAKAAHHVVDISSYHDVTHNSESQLLAAVSKGPVSVAIEADQRSFQLYHSGVFDGECGTQLDHGVLVVGYGTESGKDYWIVKNSWGESWGDEGYIKIVRGQNECGITMQPSYPVSSSAKAPRPAKPSTAKNGHYEDPKPSGCGSDEEDIQITGVSGDFCSPSCSTSSPCPSDVPDGATAKPECVLEKAGSSQPTNCALICQPSENRADGTNAACPTKATCKAISTVGVCTYDD